VDRIRDIQPPGNPHATLSNTTKLASHLLSRVAAGRNACLIWTGNIDEDGYGRGKREGKTGYAHRLSYAEFVGPIPDKMQIDHVCHSTDAACAGGSSCIHRRCINPAHLEAVTPRENSLRANNSFVSINARKTRCNSGHEFTPENTYVRTNGSRRCVACQNEWSRNYKAKRGAQTQAIRSYTTKLNQAVTR
jgi:hypothetical protein